MNRFHLLSQPRSRPPIQERLYQAPFRPSQGVISQSMMHQVDPRFNEDCFSVTSETTYPGGISQGDLSLFKSDLIEKFKGLLETTQKNYADIISSVNKNNSEGIQNINKLIDNIQIKTDPSSLSLQFELIKEGIKQLEAQDWQSKTKIKEEVDKIVNKISEISANNIKKQRKKKNLDRKEICYFRQFKTKISPVPCICLIQQGSLKTRRQVLNDYKQRKLTCKCK